MKPIRVFRMLLTIGLAFAAAGASPVRADGPSEKEVLRRAFDFAAREKEAARPYRFRLNTHTTVIDGDDELVEESRTWGEYVQWSPDSVETVSEREEILFARGEDEKDASGEPSDEEKEESLDATFDFWSPEVRSLYRYMLEELERRDGRDLARIKVRPERKKRGLWKGHVWVDAATGAMLEVDIEPVKRKLGLKKMRLTGTFERLGDQIVPEHLVMFLEVKVPLIIHLKITSEMDFPENELIVP